MIVLKPITPEEAERFKKWPAYTGDFEQMDYALRDKGWLDEFAGRSDSCVFAVEWDRQPVGLSILALTEPGRAEFRVAVHPNWLGKRMGEKITLSTLATGFWQLDLDEIHLIVRKSNSPALRLYERLGFERTGESVYQLHVGPIEVIHMSLSRESFEKLHGEGEA
jgi:RimJ/RimL family protein N-acetyltransferase